jgi:hypothetical protein
VATATASLSLLMTASANATVTVDATYKPATALNPCHKLGGWDMNGVFYTTACNNQVIIRYDKNGTRLGDIALPYTAGWFGLKSYTLPVVPMDVAPSPDGSFLYLSQDSRTPVRLNRQADGTYKLDAAWKLQAFPAGGKNWTPIGNHITVDGLGSIYLSNGSYWVSNAVATPGQIVKFAPDGSYLTSFGDVGPVDGQWNANQDVAVSRDGRRVYVGENCSTSCQNGAVDYQPSRITRYDYTPSGQYRFTKIISRVGPYNGKKYPQCEDPGAVHSAYTLGLDARDYLYAGSVSCGYIQQFKTDPDPAKETFVKTIVKNLSGNTGVHNHWLAVDAAGRIFTAEWQLRFDPKAPAIPATPMPAPPALPAPDLQAPTIANVVLPATTTSQDIAVTITATDNVAVSEMRLADQNGTYGPWQPFASPVTVHLTNGYSIKGVFVQVRDMAGNESTAVYKTTNYVAPADAGGDGGGGDGGGGGGVQNPPAGAPDNAAPVIGSATAPAVTATREITINVAATDDKAVTQIRFANEDGNWSGWRNFAAANTWTITNGYLNKLIFVQVRDAAGNESANAQVKTRYAADAPPPAADPNAPADVVAPTLTKIEMPAESTTQNVSIAITATDAVGVAQVRFANEDGNWTNWQAYANPKTWTLSPNFGAKLVFAQVRDAAGNESMTVTAKTNHVKSKAGPLDVADPVLTKVTLPETVPTTNVTIHVTATDDIGATEVRFMNDEDPAWGPWKPIGNGDVPHTLVAGKTYRVVYAQVRDAAGRESNTLYAVTLVTP